MVLSEGYINVKNIDSTQILDQKNASYTTAHYTVCQVQGGISGKGNYLISTRFLSHYPHIRVPGRHFGAQVMN